jgi:hypothetical protein
MENPAPHLPLQHQWTFYLHYPTYNLDAQFYSDQAYERLGDFSSVQDFWNILECLPKPSDIFSQRDPAKRIVRSKVNGRTLEAFGLFKTGVKPEWEFPLNMKGGHLEFRDDIPLEVVDRIWYETLLGIVGEVLEGGRDIVGARIVDKSKTKKTEFRLEIWLATTDETIREEISHNIMTALSPYAEIELDWKVHGDSISNMIHCNAQNLGI